MRTWPAMGVAAVLVMSPPPPAVAAEAEEDGWVAVRQVDGVATYRRSVDGSHFPALQARAQFAAPARAVYEVVSDYDHFREFIPAVADSRILDREGSTLRVYQRLDFSALAADRAYVITVSDDLRRAAEGVFDVRWQLDDGATSTLPKDASVRPHRFSGSWHLEDGPGGMTTQAHYVIHVDPGGWLPAWLLAREGESYIQQVMAAVRQRLAERALH